MTPARLGLAATCGLVIYACAPTPERSFVLGKAGSTITLDLSAPRDVSAVARGWHAADVYQYDLDLQVYDAQADGWATPEFPHQLSLPQKPTPLTEASFPNLASNGRYRVNVTARGNQGGTAADQVLNAEHPASAEFDLAATDAVRRRSVAIPLDDVPFALTLRMPSNADTPNRIPAWCTGLDATLSDAAASATPLARKSYTAGQTCGFVNVRGDHHYVLDLAVHSATGVTHAVIPDFFVARADGVDLTVTPPFQLVPPTGTVLASYVLAAGSAFGVDVDAQDNLWIANQHANSVSELAASDGAPVRAPVPIGSSPRGVAVDRGTGDVWVTDGAIFGKLEHLVNGVRGTSYDVGLYPAGVVVDPQHRAWATDALGGTVTVLDAAGHKLLGSPLTLGTKPTNLAADPLSGDVWIVNSGSNSVSKVSATGVVSGPFAAGTTPGGVAIAPDHTIWVSANGDSTIHRYKPDGSQAAPTLNIDGGPSVLAIDQQTGAVWVTQLSGNVVAKLSPAGAVLGRYPVPNFPGGIVIDSQHHIWIAGDSKISELAP